MLRDSIFWKLVDLCHLYFLGGMDGGRVSRRKCILDFLSAHKNRLWRPKSLVKNELGICIGKALKKYSGLGRIVIFSINALPNQKNNIGVHFLRSFVFEFSKSLKLTSYCQAMKPLESICYKRSPVLKTTSLAGSWLNQSTHKDNNKHRENWELDLGIRISDAQWEKACILAHKCSLSTKPQETS